MFILVNGMKSSKDKGHTFIEVEKDIEGNSIRVKRMGKEFTGTSMGQNMRADGQMIRRMDLESLDTQMVTNLKGIGSKGKSQGKEH